MAKVIEIWDDKVKGMAKLTTASTKPGGNRRERRLPLSSKAHKRARRKEQLTRKEV